MPIHDPTGPTGRPPIQRIERPVPPLQRHRRRSPRLLVALLVAITTACAVAAILTFIRYH